MRLPPFIGALALVIHRRCLDAGGMNPRAIRTRIMVLESTGLLAASLVGMLGVFGCDSTTAPCDDPAPFYDHAQSAPGYVVHFEPGIDSFRATVALEEKYGFEATSITVLGFNADFPDRVRERLRCEPQVKFVERNVQPAPPPGG